MKIVYDRERIKEGIEAKAYDERNLAISKSGKYRYPSKLMFIRFLEQLKDVKGKAEIWSERNWDDGTEKIVVEVTYKVPSLKFKIKKAKNNEKKL